MNPVHDLGKDHFSSMHAPSLAHRLLATTSKAAEISEIDHTRFRAQYADNKPLPSASTPRNRMLVAQFERYQPNGKTLTDLAVAINGWLKAKEPQPQVGGHLALLDQLPHCRFVPIPWAFKGPHTPNWELTPYALMRQPKYYLDLDGGNLGLLCGWDWAAVQAKLAPPVVTICCDADDPDLAAASLQANPWLAQTFSVSGQANRAKWFFGVTGAGAERCLNSTKIVRRSDEKEVGDWLAAGKQGVCLGLHPSGCFYRPNDLPLHLIAPEGFVLPEGYDLKRDKQAIVSPHAGFLRAPRFGGAPSARRIERALEAITEADDRGVWFTMLCACKAWGVESSYEDLAYKMAEAWSRQSSKFDAGVQRATWESLRREPGEHTISAGTLFHLAGLGRNDQGGQDDCQDDYQED